MTKSTNNQETEFFEFVEEHKNTVSHPRQNAASKVQKEEITQKVAKKYECEQRVAVVGICMLLQRGGSSAGCTGNHTYTFHNVTFKLSDIRAIVKEVTGNGSSMRKVARAFASMCFEIAKRLEEPGNLYRKIQRLNPDERHEAPNIYWYSDFQANNDKCPDHVRSLINASFAKTNTQDRKKRKKKK